MSSLLRKINVISRCARIYRGNQLTGTDVEPFPHSFAYAICMHPGFSQEQIARHLCLNKSMVTRRLAQLEEHGYVTRVTSETDKRVMLVYPTEKMQEIFPRVREITQNWNRAVSENISDEEMAIFESVLERIEWKARELAGVSDDCEEDAK